MKTAPEAWDQQRGESKQAFEAFAAYRSLTGRRSCSVVGKTLGKSHHLMERWCSRWGWVERSRLYDVYLDQLRRQERHAEIEAFRMRAARQAHAKAQSLMLVDIALSQKIQTLGIDVVLGQMSVADLIALSVRGASALPQLLRAEALALGDVTDRPAEPVDGDFLTQLIQSSDDLTSRAAALVEHASDLDQVRPRGERLVCGARVSLGVPGDV